MLDVLDGLKSQLLPMLQHDPVLALLVALCYVELRRLNRSTIPAATRLARLVECLHARLLPFHHHSQEDTPR